MRVAAAADSGGEVWTRATANVRPATVLAGALLLLFVANLGRIPLLDLGERSAPILINDICVAMAIGVGALSLARARSLRLNDVSLAALLFASIGGISAAAAMPRFGLSAFELMASLAYLARWGMYFTLYVVVINCVRRSDVEGVWTAMERGLLVIAIFGLVQAVFVPNFAFVVYPAARKYQDWDVQGSRLVSTVLDPNLAGGMILVVLLVQLARLASGVRVPVWKPVVMFAALVLTLSRSAIVAFLVGLTVILVVRGMKKAMLRIAGALFVLFVASLPKLIPLARDYAKLGVRDESALARLVIWQRAVVLFLENPTFGIGFNTYGFVLEHRGVERLTSASYGAEGGLLFVAVMTGVTGLCGYLCMLWFALRRCKQSWNDPSASDAERGLLLGTGATTAAILVHSMFVNSLFVPFVMEQLWVLWGLSFVVTTSLREPSAPSIAK